MQTELEASFIYEDTPDQSKATADVKKDMESPAPMDRLVCGDVGFGKTEVAIRAAFKNLYGWKAGRYISSHNDPCLSALSNFHGNG
jgi:transcription-repair coupling factor (superfamily II helicase)